MQELVWCCCSQCYVDRRISSPLECKELQVLDRVQVLDQVPVLFVKEVGIWVVYFRMQFQNFVRPRHQVSHFHQMLQKCKSIWPEKNVNKLSHCYIQQFSWRASKHLKSHLKHTHIVVVCYIKVLLWSITIIIYGFILTPTLSWLILCLWSTE